MQIVEKIVKKQNDNLNAGVTVAFLGDSVTQGCFEVYKKYGKCIETVFDKSAAYHKYFAEIFEALCPNVPVNIINAGVSGASAPFSAQRMDESVLRHNPDLTVVCLGLNDSSFGKDKVGRYIDALSNIFDKLKENGSEIIFMTPNMACTQISPHVNDPLVLEVAQRWCDLQNDGALDLYIDSAVKLCQDKGIVVCDCYKKWKRLNQLGINTTELLSNKINHPTREMNWLFAYSLVETIFNN